MEDSRKISNQILCLVVDKGHLVLGEATAEMGHQQGRLVGPGGRFTPGQNDPMRMVQHYCQTDMKIFPEEENITLVAQKQYRCDIQGHEVLVHVYRVSDFRQIPTDTERLRKIQWFNLRSLPYDRMFAEDHYWIEAAISGGREPSRFVFSRDKKDVGLLGSDFVLTGIYALSQLVPA